MYFKISGFFQLAIHGLGHIDQLKGLGTEQLISQYVPRSIDAALAGLDDHGDRWANVVGELSQISHFNEFGLDFFWTKF